MGYDVSDHVCICSYDILKRFQPFPEVVKVEYGFRIFRPLFPQKMSMCQETGTGISRVIFIEFEYDYAGNIHPIYINESPFRSPLSRCL